jgi:hypothetical protein
LPSVASRCHKVMSEPELITRLENRCDDVRAQ